MPISAVYFGVILIWSTTPLAIKWSGESMHYMLALSSRMFLGLLICLVFLALLQRALPWNRVAVKIYIASSLGIFAGMFCVYWAAPFIDSGLISVLFGLSPIITSVFAAIWLGERSLQVHKLLGMTLGLVGLSLIFIHELQLGSNAIYGVIGILVSVMLHSLSGVFIKNLHQKNPQVHIDAFSITTGGLLMSAPLFALSLWLPIPNNVSAQGLWSVLYLSVFGSVIGFILYYHLVRRLEASRVALLTLITPICALILGNIFNNESLSLHIILGISCVLFGLAVFQWGAILLEMAVSAMSRLKIRCALLGLCQ